MTQKELNTSIPLIGFAGSPWTLLCYAVQGQGSKNFDKANEAKKKLENDMEHLVFSDYVFHGDPIHLNDIQPVEKSGPYWKMGDLFLSLRSQNMIILY